MKTCERCGLLINDSFSCEWESVLDGEKYHQPTPWKSEPSDDPIYNDEAVVNCPECGVAPGFPHHQNCPLEFCPVCNVKRSSCIHSGNLVEFKPHFVPDLGTILNRSIPYIIGAMFIATAILVAMVNSRL